MQNAENLQVMGESRGLAIAVYRATMAFPATERFGLTAQMRRSAISIGSNIAEGCGRSGNRELTQFLHIALGSASELEFQTRIAADLGMLPPAEIRPLQEQVGRLKKMLAKLIKSLRARATHPANA
jgi:four helix bundle protein